MQSPNDDNISPFLAVGLTCGIVTFISSAVWKGLAERRLEVVQGGVMVRYCRQNEDVVVVVAGG
jgi:hypothetical protein